ncbi:MAG: MFS transporter [Pseudonocardiales bacterium]|nr:MAG: MFS transporter [Pseudonocardiales bacterium]
MSDTESGTLPVSATPAHDSTWWAAVALLFAAAFGTNVPTPLLLIYRDRLDISPTVLTAIFGVYALGLAPSLLFGGPASDRFGRTRVLVPAIVLAGVASLVFVPGANSVPMLFLARFVQGLASGAAFSVGSAWLQDLVGKAHASVAARRASLALNIGFCLGPLSAGLLAQYGPHPLALPYVVHVVLVAVMLAAAYAVTRHGAWAASRLGSPGSGLLPRTGLRGQARRTFRRTLIPTAICVYAFPSVAITVLPLVLAHQSHVVAFTGVLSAVTLGFGALVQPFAHRLGRRRGAIGAGLGALGYTVGALTAVLHSLPLVLVGGALLGAGGGLCLNAGLTLVAQLSTHETRGATNGVFYAWAYLGFATPLLTTAFVDVDRLVGPLVTLAAVSALTAAWLRWRLVSEDR